jgi:RNA polymerase sigma factor (sigma-70 family)
MLLTSENDTVQADTTQHSTGSQPVRSANRHTELEEFLRESNNALISYVNSWVRSRADAVDIVQEVYCRVFRLGDMGAVRHLRGYLFKAAKNIVTDWVRQRMVREAFAQDELLRSNLEAASPERIWLAREELEALQREVEALPPKCRFALVMVKLEGASYEEVGAHLGIKTHSARRLVERAMEYLLEPASQGTLTPRGKRRDERRKKDCQKKEGRTGSVRLVAPSIVGS